MNRRAPWAAAISILVVVAACTVPSLQSLGDRGCDVDAGHPCTSPYQCVSGTCQIPAGGECKSGAREACGTDAGECVPGQRVCGSDLEWSTCVGDTAPTTEICDGLDNDCDTVVDDACVDGGS